LGLPSGNDTSGAKNLTKKALGKVGRTVMPALGFTDAAERLSNKDYTGAGISAAAGAIGLVPAWPAQLASGGLELVNMTRDEAQALGGYDKLAKEISKNFTPEYDPSYLPENPEQSEGLVSGTKAAYAGTKAAYNRGKDFVKYLGRDKSLPPEPPRVTGGTLDQGPTTIGGVQRPAGTVSYSDQPGTARTVQQRDLLPGETPDQALRRIANQPKAKDLEIQRQNQQMSPRNQNATRSSSDAGTTKSNTKEPAASSIKAKEPRPGLAKSKERDALERRRDRKAEIDAQRARKAEIDAQYPELTDIVHVPPGTPLRRVTPDKLTKPGNDSVDSFRPGYDSNQPVKTNNTPSSFNEPAWDPNWDPNGQLDPDKLPAPKSGMFNYIKNNPKKSAAAATGIGYAADELLKDLDEASRKKAKEVDYDAIDHDQSVARLRHLAGIGPMKTVWDPEKRVYKNVPAADQPQKK
jgi:hypothetical protein